jgi:hypothetical protein
VIRIEGNKKGKSISFTHHELAADGIEAGRKFSLKYYQSIEGDLILPLGFNAEKVILWVVPKDKNLDTQRKTYQWKPLIAQITDGEIY